MNVCIIGIGSNIDAPENIAEMLVHLAKEVDIIQVSEMVTTKPIGLLNQADFTNGAVKIATEKELEELTVLLKSIEDKMGRDRNQPKFGPRNIDLDVLIWNDSIIDQDYYSREFLRNAAYELGFKPAK